MQLIPLVSDIELDYRILGKEWMLPEERTLAYQVYFKETKKRKIRRTAVGGDLFLNNNEDNDRKLGIVSGVDGSKGNTGTKKMNNFFFIARHVFLKISKISQDKV